MNDLISLMAGCIRVDPPIFVQLVPLLIEVSWILVFITAKEEEVVRHLLDNLQLAEVNYELCIITLFSQSAMSPSFHY